ncbi:MAG: glycosyltransferase [Bacteroidota bacterium]
MKQPPPKVLVAALDWGLGHATRSIPIIDHLLAAEVEVWLAGAGRSAEFLQLRYPKLNFLKLSPYKVRYSKKYFLLLGIFAQIPRLINVIRKERAELSRFQQQHHFQLIISDNRYGLHLKGLKSVFICHQLAPIPWPNVKLIHKLVFGLHQWWLRPFSQVWIPDFAGNFNLSGILSHRFPPPENACFIGPLSRFNRSEITSVRRSRNLPSKAPEILIVLSGPEPQRSYLEAKIKAQWLDIKASIWLVQGKTEQTNYEICNEHLLISFLETEDLQWALQNAQIVISRPGYSSIMDYAVLGLQKVILIPTPGQTEQEYLAEGLAQQKIALKLPQSKLDLPAAIKEIAHYKGFDTIEVEEEGLRSAIEAVLEL